MRKYWLLTGIVFFTISIIFTGCDLFEEEEDPPSTPTGVKANNWVNSDSLIIIWNEDNDGWVETYNIYRSLNSDGTFTKIGNTSRSFTSYYDYDVQQNTTYYYQVSAENKGGESPKSETVSVTTNPIFAPTGLSVEATSSNSVIVSWDAVETATGYKIFRNTRGLGDFPKIGETSSTSFTVDSGLDSGTRYYFKVASYNNANESIQSEDVSITMPEGVPGIPSTFSPRLGPKHINLEWRAVAGADTYSVYRSLDASGPFELLDDKIQDENNMNKTYSYMDIDVEQNITYYYKISASNAYGEGDPSSRSVKISKDYGRFQSDAIINGDTFGYFPDGYNSVWYSFTRTYGSINISALDKNGSSDYTGDIVVTLYLGNNLATLLGGGHFVDIDIGRGADDTNNIKANILDGYGGTFYIKVEPKSSLDSNKGTYRISY